MRLLDAILIVALVFGCQISYWIGRVSMAIEVRRLGRLPDHLKGNSRGKA